MKLKLYLLSLASFLVVIAIVVFSGVSLQINRTLLDPSIRWTGLAIFLVGYLVRVLAWIASGSYDIQDEPEKKRLKSGIFAIMDNPKLWGAFIMYVGMSVGLCSMIGLVLSFAIILPITLYRRKMIDESRIFLNQKTVSQAYRIEN